MKILHTVLCISYGTYKDNFICPTIDSFLSLQ